MTIVAPQPRVDTDRSRSPREAAARLAGWAGVAFAVVFVVGFLVGGNTPAYDEPDRAWIEWVDDSGNRAVWVTGAFLITAAGLLLMTFVTSLAAYLRSAIDPDRAHVVEVGRGAGVIAGATMMLAAITAAAVPAGMTFAPDFEAPSADVIRTLDQLGFGILLVGTGWSTAVAVACLARAAAGAGMLPGWLTVASSVAAVALLFTFMFLPLVLIPLWALVTGVVLLRAARRGGSRR